MSDKNQLSSPQSIAAFSALVATAMTGFYFQNKITTINKEISELKEQVNEIEQVLADVTPNVDPNIKKNLDHIVKAINILDQQIKTKSFMQADEIIPGVPNYKRLTAKTTEEKSTKKQKSSRSSVTRKSESSDSSSSSEESSSEDESSSEIDSDDEAAMIALQN